jgi:hypothetical protein
VNNVLIRHTFADPLDPIHDQTGESRWESASFSVRSLAHPTCSLHTLLFWFTKRVAVERVLRLSGLLIEVMYGCVYVCNIGFYSARKDLVSSNKIAYVSTTLLKCSLLRPQ